MKLIADSGSTKTDWALSDGRTIQTQGINPFHQSEDTIRRILSDELLPALDSQDSVRNIYFYGSGCRPELVPLVERLLREAFPGAATVEVRSDLVGAARAVCGHDAGVACILGTGSNSCLYDGHDIVQNTPSLGYILGDEGSGAVLGARFLNALYKGRLPAEVKERFEEWSGLTMADIINKVYREPMANRFLASLSLFVHSQLECPEVWQLVVDNFRQFLRHNVVPYGRPDLPVGFVGSMAQHYYRQLSEAIDAEHLLMGPLLGSPIQGLVRYHSQPSHQPA